MELFSSYVPTGGKEEEGRGQQTPRKKIRFFRQRKGRHFPWKKRKENKCEKKVHRLSLLFGHGGGRAPHIKERGRRREKQPLFCEGTAATAEKK